MGSSLVGANIIILANSHNPSIASKEWLKEKKIIEEEIINFTHTPMLSVVESNNFLLIVDTERLQVQAKNTNDKNLDELVRIVDKYLTCLPETPYNAIGFNYIYQIPSESKFLKIIFPINEKFKDVFPEDYKIGGTIFYNIMDFKITLNFQPSMDEKIAASFNCHIDSTVLEKIKDGLAAYYEIKKECGKILEVLFSE